MRVDVCEQRRLLEHREKEIEDRNSLLRQAKLTIEELQRELERTRSLGTRSVLLETQVQELAHRDGDRLQEILILQDKIEDLQRSLMQETNNVHVEKSRYRELESEWEKSKEEVGMLGSLLDECLQQIEDHDKDHVDPPVDGEEKRSRESIENDRLKSELTIKEGEAEFFKQRVEELESGPKSMLIPIHSIVN
jgi:hypothetical protein